ncbi:hypothetical protein MTR_8g071020 [Medicago truncatula]|uniref:Uncharacterized protein n=1 Tax=Medicago truncatula TaxID=3880 RepID=A0A072TS97_MEDTR|nr:hypothetical protein MTR_8g071020 [Medicago truncatula]
MTSTMDQLGNSFGGKLPIPDSKNWDRWHKHINVLFGFKDVAGIIESGVEPLVENTTDVERTAHKEQKKKNYKERWGNLAKGPHM